MPLFTTPERRTLAKLTPAAALLVKAKAAAAAELGGDRWTPEDREEVALEVVARTLAKLAPMAKVDKRRRKLAPVGKLPSYPTAYLRACHAVKVADQQPPSDDAWSRVLRSQSPAATFPVLCGIARNQRAAKLAAAERAASDDKLAAIEASRTPIAALIDQRVRGSAGQDAAPDDVRRVAERFCAALDLPAMPRFDVLAWSFARDLPEGNAARGTLSQSDLAREMEMTPSQYRTELQRARADMRKLYPQPAEVIARLVGHSPSLTAGTPADPDAGTPAEPGEFRFAADPDGPWPTIAGGYVVDARRELDTATSDLPSQTREGTDKGNRPERVTGNTPAERRAAARRVCRVSKLPAADRAPRGKLARRTTQDRLRARRNLAAAYRREQESRDGTRKLAVAAVNPGTLTPAPMADGGPGRTL